MPYSVLIQQISALAARVDSADEFVQGAVTYLADAFDVIRVSLALRPTPGSRVAYHEAQTAQASKSKPRFLFSRRIATRGTEYGRLEVESTHPVKDAVLALETIGQLVGLFAEERRLIETNAALTGELQDLEQALTTAKVLARASGLVAHMMNTTRETAEGWIKAEAARTNRPVYTIADRIVHSQQGKPAVRRLA